MGVQKLSELCYISKHFYVMGCDHAGSFLLYLLAIYKGHLPCRDLFPILNGGGEFLSQIPPDLIALYIADITSAGSNGLTS